MEKIIPPTNPHQGRLVIILLMIKRKTIQIMLTIKTAILQGKVIPALPQIKAARNQIILQMKIIPEIIRGKIIPALPQIKAVRNQIIQQTKITTAILQIKVMQATRQIKAARNQIIPQTKIIPAIIQDKIMQERKIRVQIMRATPLLPQRKITIQFSHLYQVIQKILHNLIHRSSQIRMRRVPRIRLRG